MRRLKLYFKTKKALRKRIVDLERRVEELTDENKEHAFVNEVLNKSLDESYEKIQRLRSGRSDFYGK